jgi:hypothetical protein
MNRRTHKAFWAAFWSGIAAPGMVCASETPKISRIETAHSSHKSARDAMRSDWVKIGQDFNTVITREKAAN